ncbi:MAG: hypothetical protein WCL50_13245, partial [Spirochaetota bacterium]
LQHAHLPFGVITRKALHRLGDFRLVILPNLLRMDEEEMIALRSWVMEGGRLYASASTSLTLTGGRRLPNFGLADLFGCDADPKGFEGSGTDAAGSLKGPLAYIEPKDAGLREAILPQAYLSQGLRMNSSPSLVSLLPIRGDPEGSTTDVLATLRLPYGFPEPGRVGDENWASIHSSPPWTDSGLPVVVENRVGKGRVIFSAADIEAVDHWAHEGFFLSLAKRLLEGGVSFGTDAHPAVWMSVFHQRDARRYVLCFLNYQREEPVIPLFGCLFFCMLPAGCRPKRLLSAPGLEPLDFECSDAGRVSGRLDRLDLFRLLVLDY